MLGQAEFGSLATFLSVNVGRYLFQRSLFDLVLVAIVRGVFVLLLFVTILDQLQSISISICQCQSVFVAIVVLLLLVVFPILLLVVFIPISVQNTKHPITFIHVSISIYQFVGVIIATNFWIYRMRSSWKILPVFGILMAVLSLCYGGVKAYFVFVEGVKDFGLGGGIVEISCRKKC